MNQQRHPKNPTKSDRKSYHNSLHSVHKPLQKPMTKHFIAPLPPTRPKVYDVDALNFKKVVHSLTSTPEFLSTRRLKDVAPPPLVLSTLPAKQSLFPVPTPQPPSPLLEISGEMLNPLPDFYNYLNETLESDTTTTFSLKSSSVHDMDYFGDFGSVGFSYDPSAAGGAPTSPLRFSMSPNSLSWCYSGLLSPGTLSAVL